jgi:hypothetical protein
VRGRKPRVRFRSNFDHGTLTSGSRTVEGNAEVGGVKNSPHLARHAADYWGSDLNALRDEVAGYYGSGARVAIHNGPRRPHVHADLPNYTVPYFGKDGTKGLR